MSMALAFILYAVSSGPLPSFHALASFDTAAHCAAAAEAMQKQVATGQEGATLICLSIDDLKQLAAKALPASP